MMRIPIICGRAALALILFAGFFRAMMGLAQTPHWDVDPLTTTLPETALTPAMGLALDAIIWLGVGLAIAGERLAGRTIMWRSGALIGIGLIGVILHGLILVPIGASGINGDFRSLTLGSVWIAAFAGAWAIAHLARDEPTRRAVAFSLLGFIAMLAAVGVHEMTIGHQATVAEFEANRERSLAAHGLAPGSAMARAFERRLGQPEATGWFGMANVYGSFAAASLVGWFGLTLAGVGSRGRGAARIALPLFFVVISAVALFISGSKGAVVAAALGVVISSVVVMGASRIRFTPVRGGVIAMGALALPLIAVAIRGAVGTRWDELSILFRWHYLVAAARIFGEHPIVGVGPAGFKVAYTTAKVPINPEIVASPHSALFDWAATLGLFGVVLGVLWLGWVWIAGSRLATTEDASIPDGSSWKPAAYTALLTITFAAAASIAVESLTTTRSELDYRLAGLVVWGTVVVLGARSSVGGRGLTVAIACVALTLAAHAQIELTPVWSNAAPLFMLFFGLAVAPADERQQTAGRKHGPREASPAALPILISIGIVFFAALPAWRWEHELERAARAVSGAREAAQGEAIPKLTEARDRLHAADRIIPSDPDPLNHAVRIGIIIAGIERDRDPGATVCAALDRATWDAVEATERWPERASAWSRLARFEEAAARLSDAPRALQRAANAWQRAAQIDPLALTPAYEAWRLHRRLGHEQIADRWAWEALRIDALLFLDPLVGLTGDQRAELEMDAARFEARTPTPDPVAP